MVGCCDVLFALEIRALSQPILVLHLMLTVEVALVSSFQSRACVFLCQVLGKPEGSKAAPRPPRLSVAGGGVTLQE